MTLLQEQEEHLWDLYGKMGHCEDDKAERENYDAIFALLEGSGNQDAIAAIQDTMMYRKFVLRESLMLFADAFYQGFKQSLRK